MKSNLEELSKWYGNIELDFDRQLISYRFHEIKKHFKGQTCLEIAPAQGVMTALLVDCFLRIDLVEGSKNLLDQIPNYKNVTKYHSLIEEFSTEMEYDTIIMDHVLEHIENPLATLKSIYKLLKPNGVFIVGVPNALSLHRLLGVEMGYLSSPYELNERDHILGHYRVYDTENLNKDIIKAGFKVVENDGVFLKLLSNKQIQSTFDEDLKLGCLKLGRKFRNNCAEIYCIATK